MLADEQYSYKLRMGKKGLIALPSQVKNSFNISPGNCLEMYVEGDAIVMKLQETTADFNLPKEFQLVVK